MKTRPRLQAVLLAAVLALVLLLPATVRAQAPQAGTSIGNQATATYTDGSGTTRAVTSNVVSTVVQQVASLRPPDMASAGRHRTCQLPATPASS